MEVFGKVHPSRRQYGQWDQMTEKERALHRNEMADIYIMTAGKYGHDAIFLHPNPGRTDEVRKLVELVRQKTGDKYFLMIHGDATFSVPNGTQLAEFAYRLVDDPAGVHAEARRMVDNAVTRAGELQGCGLDGFALCSDYCFNSGPFLSPAQFSEFVTPYLAELIAAERAMGYYIIKHTDGNIMPILDDLVGAKPHALHSLDPQGSVDIAEVKRRVGDKVCLIGNVSCSALDTGTEHDVIASARYCLEHGMPRGGYIFSTSNCIYTGMDIRRYDLMLDVWRKHGNYPAGGAAAASTPKKKKAK